MGVVEDALLDVAGAEELEAVLYVVDEVELAVAEYGEDVYTTV